MGQNEAVSALPKIITTGFRAIQLIYFFTAGDDEVKCWQIRKGAKAPQARIDLIFSGSGQLCLYRNAGSRWSCQS